MRPLSVLGAPSSAGAYAPGQERAPAHFRSAGLIEMLRSQGRGVIDHGDVAHFRWRPDHGNPRCANLAEVRRVASAVADEVSAALDRGDDVLVLGGDCTLEIGTVAGATGAGASVGLVYIDLDTDLNAPHTSDGALDWTGVAHMLDIPGCAAELSGLGKQKPLLPADAILFLAVDNISAPEASTMRHLGLQAIPLAEVKGNLPDAIDRARQWARRFDRLLLHLDVDVLEYVDFPIAENVRREPGLSFTELSALLPPLAACENFRALTVAEANPDHAPDPNAAFAALNRLLASALCPRRHSIGS